MERHAVPFAIEHDRSEAEWFDRMPGGEHSATMALNAVESHGGKVLSAMHSIEPFGFRAIVLDSEGNRVALHSM